MEGMKRNVGREHFQISHVFPSTKLISFSPQLANALLTSMTLPK